LIFSSISHNIGLQKGTNQILSSYIGEITDKSIFLAFEPFCYYFSPFLFLYCKKDESNSFSRSHRHNRLQYIHEFIHYISTLVDPFSEHYMGEYRRKKPTQFHDFQLKYFPCQYHRKWQYRRIALAFEVFITNHFECVVNDVIF
jgi:hypothetical protein